MAGCWKGLVIPFAPPLPPAAQCSRVNTPVPTAVLPGTPRTPSATRRRPVDAGRRSSVTGRRRLWIATAAAAVVAVLAVVVRHEPAFYRQDLDTADPRVEQQARRLVSKVSAVQAAWSQPGAWEAVLDEEEINAWLATDLPRNHPQLLPSGIDAPRVDLEPQRIAVAVRVGRWPLSAVASCRAEVVLRDVNRLGVAVEQVALGGVPVPSGPLLHDLARRLTAAGLAADLRRLDGRTLLVIVIPPGSPDGGPTRSLERFSIDTGSVVFAGRTVPPAATTPP